MTDRDVAGSSFTSRFARGSEPGRCGGDWSGRQRDGDSGGAVACSWICDVDSKAWCSSRSGHDEKGKERGDCGSGALDEGVGMSTVL